MAVIAKLYQDPLIVGKLQPQAFVEGIIAAVSCCPEIPMPPQWMPWVFAADAGDDLAGGDMARWELITDCLVRQLRDILSALRAGETLLPTSYQYEPAAGSKSSQAMWLQGFLLAHQQLQPVWQNAWEHLQVQSDDAAAVEAANTLKHCLKVFSVLADPDNLTIKSEQQDFREQLPSIAKTLPRALNQYAQLANTLAGYLPNQFESFTQQMTPQ